MNDQYFEGILQLRNPNSLVLEFIATETENRKGVFISKTVKVANGIDFYFSSQRFLQRLGHKLKEKFGGELKINESLHTRDHLTSKDLYRVNVYFRVLNIKKGDKVMIRGEEFEIIGIGKKILAKSLENGRKSQLKFEDLP